MLRLLLRYDQQRGTRFSVPQCLTEGGAEHVDYLPASEFPKSFCNRLYNQTRTFWNKMS